MHSILNAITRQLHFFLQILARDLSAVTRGDFVCSKKREMLTMNSKTAARNRSVSQILKLKPRLCGSAFSFCGSGSSCFFNVDPDSDPA